MEDFFGHVRQAGLTGIIELFQVLDDKTCPDEGIDHVGQRPDAFSHDRTEAG